MENIDEFFETVSWHNEFNQSAFKFCICFSRFEYALKRAGYVFTPRNSTIAHASINDFISEIDGLIDINDDSIKAQVDYIFNNPPNTLHSVEGRLHWIPITPQSKSIEFLLLCMRTTRNNLFHGNKQLPGNGLDRNQRLIHAFLPIIDKFLEVNDQVRSYYLETLEE